MSEDIRADEADEDNEQEVSSIRPKKKRESMDSSKKTDLMKVTGSMLSNVNYKMVFILFFLGMLIFSDIFIENVISKFSDSVFGECTTSKGTVIQLLFLCLFYIIFDLLIKYDVI